jgi:hypothetical protein
MTRRDDLRFTLPPAFLSVELQTLTSHYGHPHKIAIEPRDGEWAVKCSWGDRDAYGVVGSKEEALIVVETLRSDFMP